MGGKKKAAAKKGGGAGNADDEEKLRKFVNDLFRQYEKECKKLEISKNKGIMKPYLEDFVEDDKTPPDKVNNHSSIILILFRSTSGIQKKKTLRPEVKILLSVGKAVLPF